MDDEVTSNPFERAEQESFRHILSELQNARDRTEDTENSQIILDEPIVSLTPSDDLERCKAKINEIVDVLNKSFLRLGGV